MAKESKHAAGPWEANKYNEIVSSHTRSQLLAYCVGDGLAMKANARLIAAAPELLEALKLATRHITKCPIGHHQESLDTLRIGQEVIQKATEG